MLIQKILSSYYHKSYRLLLALCLVILTLCGKAQAAKDPTLFPKSKIVALNYHEGFSEITPGLNFSIDVSLATAADFPETGRYQLPIAFYLVTSDQLNNLNKENIAAASLYLGRGFVRSPRKGTQINTVDISVSEDLLGHAGSYNLVAWLDPKASKINSSKSPLFISPLSLTLSDNLYNKAALSIENITLDQQVTLANESEQKVLGGALTLQSRFINTSSAIISACLVLADQSCQSIEVWDSIIQSYGSSFKVLGLERNDKVTTLFQLKLPPLQASDAFKIRFRVLDENAIAEGAESEANFGVIAGPLANYFDESDFARDMRNRISMAKATLKRERLKGKIPNPVLTFKRAKNGEFSIDLVKSLDTIVSNSKLVTAKATSAYIEPDSSALPDSLMSSIPGSRFNMPDQDFPWLKGLEVKADPPPPQYNGVGFPNIAQYRRCIPFFCGPNSPDEAGKEPSESCIRRFCGTTFEDLRYGGRNVNLLNVDTGFDKSFSASGFGARVGVSGNAKVYRDKAISDYVAASYTTNAFFGVKVFSYSVPIFEVGSQSVYSPTEIGESMSRNLLKILGRVIEKREGTSSGLSLSFSQTYGVKKKAEVGVGPIDVDIEVEAGGTGGISLGIGQIDVLRGIVGNLTPSAAIGAKAKAVTDIGIGRFGISGELTLIRDSVPVVATFNAGLDIAAKVVRPQLNLNISNVLEGPNGRIDLILVVGISPLDITYSTKLVSFSTGSFTTSIYNKDTIFAQIPYS